MQMSNPFLLFLILFAVLLMFLFRLRLLLRIMQLKINLVHAKICWKLRFMDLKKE